MAGVVVHAALREDVCDLLIEAALGSSDISDAFEQLLEVVDAQVVAIFKALIVHSESLNDVFLEALRRPNAELGPSEGAHAITNGDNHVEVVVQYTISLPIAGSCQVFLDN